MMYELNKQGFAMVVLDTLKAIYKENATPPYYEYVDPIAVYNNLEKVSNAIEKYQKRIRRKNADKDKAYGLLLMDIYDYEVLKKTEYGQKQFDKFLAQINKVKERMMKNEIEIRNKQNYK